MEPIWKLLVGIFWLVTAGVVLLVASEINSSFLFIAAMILAFVGVAAGLLAIADHRESKKDSREE